MANKMKSNKVMKIVARIAKFQVRIAKLTGDLTKAVAELDIESKKPGRKAKAKTEVKVPAKRGRKPGRAASTKDAKSVKPKRKYTRKDKSIPSAPVSTPETVGSVPEASTPQVSQEPISLAA